jgi:glycosyltransferase involved in cell wall biosynthesis
MKKNIISIIVPAYNEEENIARCISKISSIMNTLNSSWEIIVVDDGSKDKTIPILNKLKNSQDNLTVIAHDTNMGPGAAFRNGFKAAKGNIIITIDSDLSYSPEKIPLLLKYLGKYDIVIGSWNKNGARLLNVPLDRVIISKVAHFLDMLMLGVNLSSLSSFFVAYKSSVIKNIPFKSNGFDAQCEIITRIYRKRYKIKEVPVNLAWSTDRRNKSKLKLLKEIKNRIALWARLNIK